MTDDMPLDQQTGQLERRRLPAMWTALFNTLDDDDQQSVLSALARNPDTDAART